MVDYDRYTELVNKESREDRMPRTPNKNRKYSRRQWDGLVKNWKQQIHLTVSSLDAAQEDINNEAVKDLKFDEVDNFVTNDVSSWAEEVEAEEAIQSNAYKYEKMTKELVRIEHD